MRLVLALVLALAAGAAFAQGGSTGNPNPSFNLVNRGAAAMTEFFATAAGRANWGRSRLDGRKVPPGGRFAVRLPADGNCIYDLRAVFADGSNEERRGVNACAVEDVALGGAPPPAAASKPPNDPSFRLVNRADSAVQGLHVMPSPSADWGPNLLPGGTLIAVGDSRLVRLPAGQGCSFDLRVVFQNRHVRERRATDLCKVTDLPVQ